MMRVEEVEDGRVVALKYIGKEYIVRNKEGKYLLRIDRSPNTGNIRDAWTIKKKFAMVLKPKEACQSIGVFSVDSVMAEFPNAIKEEINAKN